jgi:vacuolar-type H+-ATPase subunit H
MERNPNNPPELSSSSQGLGAGSDRLNADLTDTTGNRSASAFSDTSGTLGQESLGGGESKVQRRADALKEKANQLTGQVRERATTLKATLADKLEAGAERIRQKASRPGEVVGENVSAETKGNLQNVGQKVASGMENTADWIRNADIASMRSGIENQVRTNPGRTLLIALGVGYVLGRALRGRGE